MSRYRTLSDIYLKARSHLYSRGWAQDWGYEDGATCLMGAIHLAGGASRTDQSLAHSVEKDVKTYLMQLIRERDGTYHPNPMRWNDSLGRKRKDVIQLLTDASELVLGLEVLEEVREAKIVPSLGTKKRAARSGPKRKAVATEQQRVKQTA